MDPHSREPSRIDALTTPDGFQPRNIESLLAFSRNGLPIEFLVSVRPDERSPVELWVLRIAGQAITDAQPADLSAFDNREAFFSRFDAPRCKHGDRRCLRIGTSKGGTTLLYEEPEAGHSRHRLQRIDDIKVGDAAWTSAARADEHDATLYLLVPCAAQGGD